MGYMILKYVKIKVSINNFFFFFFFNLKMIIQE